MLTKRVNTATSRLNNQHRAQARTRRVKSRAAQTLTPATIASEDQWILGESLKVCEFVATQQHTHTRKHTRKHARTHACTHARTHVCTRTHTTYAHTIYTHTHARMNPSHHTAVARSAAAATHL
jgi:hypothetical protein